MPDSSEQLTTGVDMSGTNPLDQTKLGVFAPLDVQGAKSQASLLAQSLGVVDDRMQRPLMYAERAESSQNAKQEALQGEADASNGTVDNSNPYQAYQDAVTRTSVTSSALKSIQTVKQKLATPVAQGGWFGLPLQSSGTNPDGSPQPSIIGNMDAQFKQDLGGLENDAQSAAILHPILQGFMGEVAGAEIKKQQEQNLQNGIATTTALGVQAAESRNETAWNYEDQVAHLLPYYGGDRTQANTQMMHIIATVATNPDNPDPTAIDWMLQSAKKDGGIDPAKVPANQAILDEARTEATRMLTAKNAGQASQQQLSFQVPIVTAQAQGQVIPNLLPKLQEGLTKGWLGTGSEAVNKALDYVRKNAENGQIGEVDQTFQQAFTGGTSWTALVGHSVMVDGKPRYLTVEDAQHGFDNFVQQAVTQAGPRASEAGVAFQQSQRTGLAYTPLKTTLEHIPLTPGSPTSPGGVTQVRQAWEAMSSDMSTRALYFSDAGRNETVQAIEAMHQGGMSDDIIAAQLQKVDPKQANESYTKLTLPKVTAAIHSMVAAPKTGLPFFGDSSLKVSDITNSGQLTARVTQEANLIGSQGLVTDPKQIVKMAFQAVADRSYVIRTGTHGTLVVPRTSDDPPMVQQSMQDFYTHQMPAVAKAINYKGDVNDLRLVPNPMQPGTLQLVDHTGIPQSPQTFTYDAISKAYADRLGVDTHKAQADLEVRLQARSKAAAEATAAIQKWGTSGFVSTATATANAAEQLHH